jgi:hypothetical protein
MQTGSGEFFNVKKDPYEKESIAENKLSSDVILIKNQFQDVLAKMHVEVLE